MYVYNNIRLYIRFYIRLYIRLYIYIYLSLYIYIVGRVHFDVGHGYLYEAQQSLIFHIIDFFPFLPLPPFSSLFLLPLARLSPGKTNLYFQPACIRLFSFLITFPFHTQMHICIMCVCLKKNYIYIYLFF